MLACGAVVTGGLLAAPTAFADESPYTGPVAIPGEADLGASVTWFQVEGSVTQFVVDGSVTELRQETTTATQVVVTVNADVLFEFASATLSAPAAAQLDAEARRVPKAGAVAVDGYTDAIGTESANLQLSRRRAQAIADRLKAARPDLRVSAVGHGEANPVVPNELGGKDNPAGRAKNRRVTLTYGR